MIPGNALSADPHPSNFISPKDQEETAGPLFSIALGGFAYQDVSQGLDYQNWELNYDPLSGEIKIIGSVNLEEITLPSIVGMKSFSFVFSELMEIDWVYTASDDSIVLNYFDPASEENKNLVLNSSNRSPKLVMDRDGDMILSYVRGTGLYARYDFDGYETEYLLRNNLTPGTKIITFGMSDLQRLQWKLVVPV